MVSQIWRSGLRKQPLLAVLGLFLSMMAARAEAPDRCEQNAPCRKLLQQARQLFAAGRYDKARPAFEKAFALTGEKDARLLMDIGRTQQFLGNLDEAVSTYRRLLATVPHDAPERDIVLPWLRELLLTNQSEDLPEAASSAPAHPSPPAKPRTTKSPAPPKTSELILPLEAPVAPSSEPAMNDLLAPLATCNTETSSTPKKRRIAGSVLLGAGLVALTPSGVLLSQNNHEATNIMGCEPGSADHLCR